MALSLALALVLCPEANANDGLRELLEQQRQIVDAWDTAATGLFLLTFLVGVFGILTGLLQTSASKGARITAATLGALISAITLITNSASDVDYHTLNAKAYRARQLIEQAQLLELKQVAPGDEASLIDQIQPLLKDVYSIKDDIEPRCGPLVRAITFVSRVFASETGEPSWTAKPPSDADNVYAVGIADAESLDEAKRMAEQNGRQSLADYIGQQAVGDDERGGKINAERLGDYVASAAAVADSYFNYDATRKLYRYYALLRMRRDFVGVQAQLYGAREKIDIPADLEERLRRADAKGDAYAVRKLSTYRNLLDRARESIPPDQYAKAIEGLNKRKQGDNDGAIKLFEELTRSNDSFYLAWYNLALAYDAAGRAPDADRSFRKALILEREQKLDDSSLYNTYGFFLFNQHRYAEAVLPLRRALEIDPGHPKAQATLNAALVRDTSGRHPSNF